MKLTVTVPVKEMYLPNTRCRKLRERCVGRSLEVEIEEPKEFPVAFLVTDHGYRYPEGNAVFGLYTDEIRTKNGKLYKAIAYDEVVCKGIGYYPVSEKDLAYLIERSFHGAYKRKENPDVIVKTSNIEEARKEAKEKASHYILFAGKVWKETGEPMYHYTTFGLGHNHGGTGMFIEYFYNCNIPGRCYFNALEKEKAIEAACEVAKRRGDTDSIDSIRNTELNIDVLMPELVKRNPRVDHKDGGDPFMMKLESVTECTESTTEAGLLAMFVTAKEICK